MFNYLIAILLLILFILVQTLEYEELSLLNPTHTPPTSTPLPLTTPPSPPLTR